MLNKFHYRLQSPAQEQAFLSIRFTADKRKMLRIYLLALCVIPTFLIVGIALRPPSPELAILSLFRGLGIVFVLLALVTLKRTESRRAFEWSAAACLGWLTIQVGIVQQFTVVQSETILAWQIFVVFLIYLFVPISFRFRLACAIFLSVVSVSVWFRKEQGDFDLINGIGLFAVYLSANIFSIVCAINAARTEREEFLHLESEKQLKASLEIALARLEESVESRNQIYRVLAHDLRGGIGGLESISSLLVSGNNYSEQERNEFIELICESSKSSYELLENLLQWAISESGSVDPSPRTISLNQSVSNCVGFLKVIAHEKKIELKVQVDERVTVWADSKMLEAVIRNLTSNAIKFTEPEGGVHITAKEGKKGFVVISITDTGVGIDPERLSRIFDLKYDDGSDGTRGERGTNLGLRTCSEFIKKLGGEIWATSEVGRGSQFNFTLPIEPKASPEASESRLNREAELLALK